VIAKDKHLAFIEDLGRVTCYWMVIGQTIEKIRYPLELFFIENHLVSLTSSITSAQKR